MIVAEGLVKTYRPRKNEVRALDGLDPIAEWNPVSALTAPTRKLWGNPNPYAAEGFPAEQPVLLTLIWVAVMLAVFVPLAVRKYRSISR